MPNPKSNLSDVAILKKVNEGGIESLTPDELEYFAGMEEAKEVKKALADAAVLKVKAEATGGKINASNFNGGYASRVEGTDASGEYLTPAQRKENFKKQNAVSFVSGRSSGRNGVGVGKNGSVALREPSKVAPEDIKGEEGKNEEIEKLKSILVPAFAKIEGHLQSIQNTFKDESKLDKKQDRKDDILEEKAAKKGREGELEGKKKPAALQLAEKAAKPVKGLFDMIWGFVKNILMGAALIGLINIFKNFDKIKKNLIGVVNNVIGFLNFLLEVIFGPILSPINSLIGGLNMGFSAIFSAINSVLEAFKQDPIDPWQIEAIEPPQIPTIPVEPEPKVPVQKAEGGGEVTNVTNVTNITNEGSDTSKEEEGEGDDVRTAISDSSGEIDETIAQSEASLGDQISQTENLMNQIPDGEGGETTPEVQIGDLSDNLNKGLSMPPIPKDKGSSGLSMPPIPKDKGVVEGVQSAMGGGAIQRMQGGGKTKHVNASDISAKEGGAVTSQSGLKISGMGPDTQLLAAQPGEIVMSKKAVNKIGADRLLAANKSGGGDNKPKMGMVKGVQVSRMQGGGSVSPFPEGSYKGQSGQVYGDSRSYGGHVGIDVTENSPYKSDPKRPIYAPVHSKVLSEEYQTSGYTSGLMLDHGDGLQSRYVHMIPMKRPGDEVKAGEQIGKLLPLGSSPSWNSTHLHFELYKGSKLLNPTSFYQGLVKGQYKPSSSRGTGDLDKFNAGEGAKISAQVSSTSSSGASLPGAPSGSKTNVRVLPMGGPPGGSPPGSAAAADQARVNGFSAVDVNNLDLLPVRSIYNIVG